MSKKKGRWNNSGDGSQFQQPEDAGIAAAPTGKPQAIPSPTRVPKQRNKKVAAPLRTIPNTVPFIQPPATRNGEPVTGEQDWGNFSTRKQANYILEQIRTTISAVAGAVIIDLKVVDTTAIDGYVLDVPLPDKPKLSDIADFSIQGHVSVNGAANLFIDEWAGLVYARKFVPDPESGDTNYQEVGTGADAVDVVVQGALVPELLPSEDLIEFHWGKAV
jgi:hypothetical protein